MSSINISDLPKETLAEIFKFNDFHDLGSCRLTCLAFKNSINTQHLLYKQITERQFHTKIPPQMRGEKDADFVTRCKVAVNELQKEISLFQIAHPTFGHLLPTEIVSILHKPERTKEEASKLREYCQTRDTLVVWDHLANLCNTPSNNKQLLTQAHTTEDIKKQAALFKEWFNDPQNLTILQKQKNLCLSNLGLTSVPKELSLLSHLKGLYLTENQLIMVPQELGNLSNLRKLDLSVNKLSQIPKELSNSPHLEELILTENPLKTMPKELEELKQKGIVIIL